MSSSSKRQYRVNVAPAPAESYEAEQAPRRFALPIVFAALAGLVVVGLLAAILLTPSRSGGTTQAGSQASGGQGEALRIGALAPDFTLPDAYGKGSIRLSDYRGKKAVWVNFWATWCTFCKQEMPEMKALYAQHKDQGLEILGVDDAEAAAN